MHIKSAIADQNDISKESKGKSEFDSTFLLHFTTEIGLQSYWNCENVDGVEANKEQALLYKWCYENKYFFLDCTMYRANGKIVVHNGHWMNTWLFQFIAVMFVE